MSQIKTRRKAAAEPPREGMTPLPAWLQLPAFTDEERKLYLEAADRSALDVTQWARQILNHAGHATMGTPSRRTRRAPPAMALIPRRGGHARRRRPVKPPL